MILITELYDVEQIDPQVKCGPSKYYLLKEFDKIPLSIVLEQQVDTNMFCSKCEQQISNWLYALAFKSMSVERCDHVIPIYNEICSSQQCGITLTKLVISCNVIKALTNFLKIFDSKSFNLYPR